MGLTITSAEITLLLAFIAAVWGVWKILKEIRKPNADLKATVDKHDKLLDDDNKRLKEFDESNQMILKCLLVIINHEITGNGIEKMKEARDELQTFLIDR